MQQLPGRPIPESYCRNEKGRHGLAGGLCEALVLLFTSLLAAALSRQCFLQSSLFTRLQVVGVTLYFLNDVLLLHLPLEAAQRILEGLTLLKTNFRQA
jgi:hypothetical protein